MNRRQMFAGALAAPLIATVHAAEPDPLLQLIRQYEAGNAAFNAIDSRLLADDNANEAAVARTYGPPYERLLNDPPPATTRAGALEALRLARDHDCFDEVVTNMVAAALAFFEA